MITIADLEPLALAIVTQELLDVKRFRRSFCDNLLLGQREEPYPKILVLKRELNLSESGKKFFEGYRAALLFSLDKIVGSATRYASTNPALVQRIVSACKEIVNGILRADSFERISEFEPKFKSEVTLQLFKLMKEARI